MKAREQANWNTIAGAAVVAAATGIIGFFVGLSQAKTTTVEVIKEVPVVKEVLRPADPKKERDILDPLRVMNQEMSRIVNSWNRWGIKW